MSSGYSPDWLLSSDIQQPIESEMSEEFNWTDSDYLVVQGAKDLITLNQSQRFLVLNQKNMRTTRKNQHIYRKLLYRVEKYWEYKQLYPGYTEIHIIELLNQNFDTSIQYEDLYSMNRTSINPNTQPQLGTVEIPKIETDKLYVYYPEMKAARKSTEFQTNLFSKILRSESTKLQISDNSNNVYLVTKYVWNSIPMFNVVQWVGEANTRYYFFYLPIHNNSLLSTPLLDIKSSPGNMEIFLLYNSKGKLINKLSEDLF